VRVWRLPAGQELYTKPVPGAKIFCASAFSPDGKQFVTEGDGRIHVWDALTGKAIQSVMIHPRGVSAVCFNLDGSRLAVGAFYGRTVEVFKCEDSRFTEKHTLEGHHDPVASVRYSPDGKFLATGDIRQIKLWRADTLELVRTVDAPGEQLAFSPDGHTLFATATTDEPKPVFTISRRPVESLEELPGLSVQASVNPVRAFHCLSRDGKILFIAPQHDATYVKAIDTASGTEVFPRSGHVAPLQVIAVSPDGRTIASAGDDWIVKLWDLATGEVRHSLHAHTAAICGLAFSPDGKQLASGGRDGTVALWDVASGTEVRALHGHARSFSRIQFSPDGGTLAAGGENGTVNLWQVANGLPMTPLRGHQGAVRCVAFNPDGTLLASGGEDKGVLLHNLATGDLKKFKAPSSVNGVAFSPDGQSLASVGDGPEAAVCLWDVDTGQGRTWHGHKDNVLDVAFSPTAPLLATSAEDGTVCLWDIAGSGSPVRVIGPGPFGGGVRSLAFTRDGRYLCTANANGTVYALDLTTPHG
jgi:WD40 repeat protein